MVDLIVAHGYTVTMQPDRTIYSDGAVAIQGNRIIAVGKSADILARYTAAHVIDATGMLVIPGLIDGHNHPNQYLSKGIGDDTDIVSWVTKRIYPYESQLTEGDAYIGALGNFVEMIKSGTTCFNDPGGFFPDMVGGAARDVGIRAIINRSTRDLPPATDTPIPEHLFDDIDTNIRNGAEVVKKWNGAEGGRIRAWFSLRSANSATEDLAREIKKLADAAGVGIHVHAAVRLAENDSAMQRFGKRTLERLYEMGLFGPNLYLVHMGAVNDQEIGWLSEHDVKVAHCPSASMFGAYGVIWNRPIPQMIRRGVTVSLGTDSATAGRFLDLVRCMYLAACAHKDAYADPEIMNAHKALEMATIQGARACLWDDEIGSLEAGKLADLVLVDMSSIEWVPRWDPVRDFIYSASGSSIDTVIINGKVVMRRRVLLTVDEERTKSEVALASKEIVKRSGIKMESPWPIL
jgi:cytosine/adenosine deaminase-related metal-dependent hydrolase